MREPPPSKKGSPYNTKASKRIEGLGDPMAPSRISKGRGILRLLLKPQGLAQSSFKGRQGPRPLR